MGEKFVSLKIFSYTFQAILSTFYGKKSWTIILTPQDEPLGQLEAEFIP